LKKTEKILKSKDIKDIDEPKKMGMPGGLNLNGLDKSNAMKIPNV
jgi:hypothetical protein